MPHFSAKHYSIKSQKDADRAKSYADSINPETLLRTDTITNCITEIPQDIKLELVDGTLTLKAGSKVYVPNGAGVFDEKTVASDIVQNLEQLSGTNKWLLCVNQNGNGIFPRLLANCVSGAGVTTIGGWAYDTTTNLINWYSASGEKQGSNFSLPVCIFSTTDRVPTSIDQVFNGFGYIGSTVFALPGVKGLIPNGRNDDGSLKNIEFTISGVNTQAMLGTRNVFPVILQSGLQGYYAEYVVQKTRPTNPVGYTLWFNTEDNRYEQYVDGSWTISGPRMCPLSAHVTANQIDRFVPRTTFHSVDYSDSSWVSAQTMPSDKYIDLTLGASGASYKAPANGYFAIYLTKGASTNAFIRLINGSLAVQDSRGWGTSTDGPLVATMLAKKDQSVTCYYTYSGTLTYFRFVYSEGDV